MSGIPRIYASGHSTRSIAELLALAARGPVAIMRAEVVPGRCHRSLITNASVARGIVVLNIQSQHRATPHQLTPFAHVEGERRDVPGGGDSDGQRLTGDVATG